ncbi:MAG: ATP-binding protein [Acidobacteriota bacterium]|nr:ATP-binding protein [Acidobacteriota bacterium]
MGTALVGAACIFSLLICLFYLYTKMVFYVDSGISFNFDTWLVYDALETEENQGLIKPGDRLLRVGELRLGEVQPSLTAQPFAGYRAGDRVPVTLLRDGKEQSISWVITGKPPSRTYRDVLQPFGLTFWLFGTVVFLFLRPRNHQWLLLALFNFMMAVFWFVGTVSYTRIAGIAVVYEYVKWLLIPLCFHLHVTIPCVMIKRQCQFVLPLTYGLGIALAILSGFRFIHWEILQGVLFFSAILGPLVARLILKPSPAERVVVRLMILGISLVCLPWTAWHLFLKLGIGDLGLDRFMAVLTSLNLTITWPLFYVYAIYKQRMGAMEFRANRLLGFLTYVLINTLTFMFVFQVSSRRLDASQEVAVFSLIITIIFVTAAPSLHGRFQQWFERITYGGTYHPNDVIRVFAERIPTVSDRDALVHLLADEILPSLLIRQSALFLLKDGDSGPTYARGIRPDEKKASLLRSQEFLDNAGQYLPVEGRAQDHTAWVRLAVPLDIRGEAIGIWLFGRRDPDDFYSRQDITILSSLASQVAVAVENARLYDESQGRTRELQSLTRELRRMDKLKDEFLANTSHELRTPLHGMIGLAESLIDGVGGPQTEKALTNLSMIVSSGKRLSHLVDDLLDFARLKHRDLELHKKPLDLCAAVNVVITLIQPLADSKKIRLVNAIDPELSAVEADEDRLQQILNNLIGNAVKFTDSGTIRLSARQNGGTLVISVTDTGIGIPVDRQAHIFESFQQVDGSAKRARGGTGLGLSVTRQLVELHGGTIWVESEVSRGSVFSFTLPMASEIAESVVKPQTPIIEHRAPADYLEPAVIETGFSDGANFHILIVDDEPVNRQVLFNHLSVQHYAITMVPGGREALETLEQSRKFDLVLLDIMMPGMSGYEVCRKIRARYPAHELPVIFLTARSQDSDLVAGFEAGSNDYLVKPFTKSELLSRVKMHLQLLEVNRNLDRKVAERTWDLNQKNQELEKLNTIIQTINREMGFDSVIGALADQVMPLFPRAEKSAFLFLHPRRNRFEFVTASGYELDLLKKADFSLQELEHFFCGSGQTEDGVCIHRRFDHRTDSEPWKDLPMPKTMLAMALPLDGKLVGLLFIENMTDPNAFGESDVRKLMRFREHTISAIARARALEETLAAQKALVEASHNAGMAEIASNVLHEIGNVLNNVFTSNHLIRDRLHDEKWLTLLGKVVDLLQDPHHGLVKFLEHDQRGRKLPESLARICSGLKKRDEDLRKENLNLEGQIESIRATLQNQEEFIHAERLLEETNLNQLISAHAEMQVDVLRGKGIELVQDLEPLPLVNVEKSQLVRILRYLLKNAEEAVMEKNGMGRISIRTKALARGAQVSVIDDGVGITGENLERVFSQGFSTKRGAKGAGLHYCANAMKEMHGTIRVKSRGPGSGTEVILFFPAGLPEEEGLHQSDGSESGISSSTI